MSYRFFNYILKHSLPVNSHSLCTQGASVGFLNPATYLRLRRRWDCYQGFDGFFFDGFLLILVSRILRLDPPKRISFDFTSIASDVLGAGYRVAIVGGSEKDNSRFAAIVSRMFPKIHIALSQDGYSVPMSTAVLRVIASDAEVVIVGLGAPIQERFVSELRRSGWEGACFTCGGFIRQTSARKGAYYPDWVSRTGLRFVFRSVMEPHALWRYLVTYPLGILSFIYDWHCLRRITNGVENSLRISFKKA